MSTKKRAPIRFGFLTALVWLVVAAGIIFLFWQVITRISTRQPAGQQRHPEPDPGVSDHCSHRKQPNDQLLLQC